MAIFRHDQVRFSFASEAAPGGYPEVTDTLDQTGVDWAAQINQPAGDNSELIAGSRSITFDTASQTLGGLAVGDYLQIGADAAWNTEVRRVLSIGTYNGTGATGTIYLDYPTGFWHDNNEAIDQKINTAPSGTSRTSESSPVGGLNFMTYIPGVWETITTPDLTPEFLPQYFMKDSADRNISYMYRGKQTFNGALPNILLLNGYPLKYAFGSIATTGTSDGTGGSSINQSPAGTLVGDRSFTIGSAAGYTAGEFIQIDTGVNAEVRQIVDIDTLVITLNYPLQIAHADSVACEEVIGPYTHTINESAKLPTMSWDVLMRDTDETAANDFRRRYVGGTLNRATLSADEGEMLRYSWDDVQFLDIVHNQTRHSGVTGDGAGADIVDNSSNMLLTPLGLGGDMTHSGGALAAPTYPTTEPYYFSQGVLTFMGVEFARIRSFRLEINNNVEARYYLKDKGGKRTPSEFQEKNREYRLTATIALPNTLAANSTSTSLWKELILEGNYAGLGNTAALTGFDISMVFTRGTNDTITLTSPSQTATSAFGRQGCFFARATHNIETESPIQVDGELILRDVSLVVVDAIAVYP